LVSLVMKLELIAAPVVALHDQVRCHAFQARELLSLLQLTKAFAPDASPLRIRG
jgi:hypothetical protein